MVRNVAVIVVDALRYDRVGANEEGFDLTPNIDELAANGTVFSDAFTTVSNTDPAITSLHTGRHLQGHGILHHGPLVAQEEKQKIEHVTLFPEVLADEGFDTHSYTYKGRWHERGFDNEVPLGQRVSDRLYDFSWTLAEVLTTLATSVVNTLDIDRSDDRDAVDKFLDRVGTDERFYSFIHLRDTHLSYEPVRENIEEYVERYRAENRPLEDLANNRGYNTWMWDKCHEWMNRYGDGTTAVGTADLTGRYDAAVERADQKVGRLVAGLREQDLFADTMLVVLADHGEALGEHGIYYEHHGLFEPITQIPLVVSHPTIEQTREVDELVQITDLAPTILDFLDVEADFEMDGQTLRPLLTGTGEWEKREAIVAEEAWTQRQRMVRTENYKLIWSLINNNYCRYCGIKHGDTEQLYDLQEDPGEQENLASDRPEKVAQLRQTSKEVLDGLLTVTTDGEEYVEYDDEEEILEHLEELGYRT